MRKRTPALLLVALAACSATTTVTQSPTPSPSPTAAAPQPDLRFRPGNALETVAALAALGPREATSGTYRRAAEIVADELRALGYTVRFQTVQLPAGTTDEVAVDAGESVNVIAEPPGYRPRRPHVVVGGHLDTVPDSPGANDNASGIAVMIELARLVSLDLDTIPTVFVAFTGEERIRQSESDSAVVEGSRAYLDALGVRERGAIAGAINLDMVGNGDRVFVLGSGAIAAHVRDVARRIDVPTGITPTALFSDHLSFVERDIPVAWLWAGDHASLHEPWDTVDVVQRGQLRRVGDLAWESLRRFGP